jgi:hypothetical protein
MKYDNKRIGSPKSFSELLPGFMEELNLKEKLTVESLRDNWSSIAGSILSSHTMPFKIANNVLFVNADHSMFSNNIMMMKSMIISKIKVMYTDCSINTIMVSVRTINWNK